MLSTRRSKRKLDDVKDAKHDLPEKPAKREKVIKDPKSPSKAKSVKSAVTDAQSPPKDSKNVAKQVKSPAKPTNSTPKSSSKSPTRRVKSTAKSPAKVTKSAKDPRKVAKDTKKTAPKAPAPENTQPKTLAPRVSDPKSPTTEKSAATASATKASEKATTKAPATKTSIKASQKAITEAPTTKTDVAKATATRKGPRAQAAVTKVATAASQSGVKKPGPKANQATRRNSSKETMPSSPSKELSDLDQGPVKKSRATRVQAPPKVKVYPVINTILTERLNVFACGTGEYSELGLGPNPKAKIVMRPRLNTLLPLESIGIVDIAYGGMHGLALTHDGKVYSWGVNDLGALGRITKAKKDVLKDVKDTDGSSDESDDDAAIPLNEDESTPKLVEGIPEGTLIAKIAATDSASFAVTDTGFVYGWGTFRSSEGVMGFSLTTRIQLTPILIKELKNIVSICCGNDHVIALDTKGKVWGWGNGQQNQLGRRVVERTRIQATVPRQVSIPRKTVRSIHSGSYHALAVTTDGVVYSWGLNSFAQCGIYEEAKDDGTTLTISVPTIVPALAEYDIVQLDGGDRHTIALTRTGDLLAWGRMDAHQVGIGLGSLPEEDVVVDVAGKPRCLIKPHKISDNKFKFIASGTNHNIAIDKGGSAWSWGFGDCHQCGLGNVGGDVKVPTKIVNTATMGQDMKFAACGGQVSVLAGVLPATNGTTSS